MSGRGSRNNHGRGNATDTPAWLGQDPEAAREASRYANPLPSRTLILETLGGAAEPMTLDDLIGHFALGNLAAQEGLSKRLAAMVRDGEARQDRRGAYEPRAGRDTPSPASVEGTLSAHRDGFGFVVPEPGAGPDVFLPPRQMRGLMHGDRVRVRVVAVDSRGRREGSLIEVVQRGHTQIVGRLHEEHGVFSVLPSNSKHPEIVVPPDARNGARVGQVVVAELTVAHNDRTLPVGRVVEILGEYMAPGIEIEAALRSHALPHEWPPDVEREAAAIPAEVLPSQIKERVDLRKLNLVTIDGADSRDFDDAVYAQKRTFGGWTLWVAIADVGAYVAVDSPLDNEAQLRGTSVYFPSQVIPMLPESLSNGLCSLNPNVDRLSLVCEMKVDRKGEVSKAKFYEAVICSRARLIYEDVAAILEDPKSAAAQRHADQVGMLQTLHEVFKVLLAAREKRGAIDFEGTETRIVFGENRKIEKIVPVQRTVAHRLIEECMVAANVQAAKWVAEKDMPVLYRVHAPPDPEKVAVLREFLAGRALSLGGGAVPSALDYAHTLASARGREDAGVVQSMMLRSMMQARYQPDNNGHFGLALEHYAHFTSPIRRYPDLLLHRAIKHLLKRRGPKSFNYSVQNMEALGAQCSAAERRADEATRDVSAWLKCEYMQQHVGDEFPGVVTGVAGFGLFVELQGLYIDGLIHISTLDKDYYQFEPRNQRLVGERSGRVFALGQKVQVRVERVNLDDRKIDLAWVDLPSGGKAGRGARPGTPAVKKKAGKPAPAVVKAPALAPQATDDGEPPVARRRRRRR